MTTHFRSVVPILPSLDLPRTSAFWQKHFGFAELLIRDDYLILRKDEVSVHFWACTNPEIPRGSGIRINTTGVNALFESCSASGIVHSNGTLEDKPWGTREFPCLDDSGNIVWLVESLPAD